MVNGHELKAVSLQTGPLLGLSRFSLVLNGLLLCFRKISSGVCSTTSLKLVHTRGGKKEDLSGTSLAFIVAHTPPPPPHLTRGKKHFHCHLLA